MNQVQGMDILFDEIHKLKTPETVSNCCGSELIAESDICSHCKEHSEPMPYVEWFGGEVELDAIMQDASEFKNVTYNGEKIK